MESSSEIRVDNKYLKVCCCCLQDGCLRNISSEYYSSGQKEVYGDMLKDTFNVQIFNQDIQDLERQICDQCVSRLRDAAVFRQMVLDCQEMLREQLERMRSCLNDNITNMTSTVDSLDVKVEAVPFADSNYEDGTVADDINDNDILGEDLKLEFSKVEVTDPRKRKSQRKRSKLKKCKIDDDTQDAAQNGSGEKDWSKILERRGTGPILRENSLKLLAHCTACVFQWNQSRYRCFCCKEPFSDLASLRDHTTTNHTLEQIERTIIIQQNRLVKVEISTLNCKLCAEKFDNLSKVKTHLTETHNVSFVHSEDLLVPFKINGQLQCQICFENFTLFRLLNIHMNRHFQKHVCYICGSGFSNSVFLNLHKTRSHKPFKCKPCDIIFTSKSDKKTHDSTVHGVKFERKLRFPCPYCNQRFFQENFRVQHLVEKHGMEKPEHKCDVCSKVFITKSLLNNHVKNVHMKEKIHECDVCRKCFYNKSDVLRHAVTHTGEKKFACTICNSPFATKDSLRRHLRRTHVGMQ